jgi:hypothetical protein
MPQLAFGIANNISKPSDGVYDVSDIGRVEIKDDSLSVELILTDIIKTYETPGQTRSLDTTPSFSEPILLGEVSGVTTTGDQPIGLGIGAVSVPQPIPPQPLESECSLPGGTVGYSDSLVEDPPEEGAASAPPVIENPVLPTGKTFFENECDTCCHSPTNSPSQVYFLCLIVSTDPQVTSMIEKGLIDQVYSSMPALESKFARGEPGAFLQENSFMDFTKNRVISLAKSGMVPDISVTWAGWEPSIANTGVMSKTTRAYQFEKKFNYKIPPNCEHLALFTFVRLDELAFNQAYGTPTLTLPPGIYTGKIKELVVFRNFVQQELASVIVDLDSRGLSNKPTQRTASGQLYSFHPNRAMKPKKLAKISLPLGNIRNHNALNRILRVCSSSITDAVQEQLAIPKPALQHKFWFSRASTSTNVAFIMFNQEQLIAQNCFIQNLKTKELYSEQEIDTFEVEKVDLLDENNNEKINSTTGARTPVGSKLRGSTYAKTKVNDDPETINDRGGPVILSRLAELPSPSRAIKFIQIVDDSATPGKFAYRLNIRFRDPSLIFLKNATEDYLSKVEEARKTYESLNLLKHEIKKGKVKSGEFFKKILDSAKLAIAKANQILSVLPSKEYSSLSFVSYMTSLANPKATREDHDDFIKVLQTLGQTLVGLLRSAGVRIDSIDNIGPTTDNNRSSTNKRNISVETTIQSQEFSAGTGTGIGFLETSNPDGQLTNSVLAYDTKFLKDRADIEFGRFWDISKASTLGSSEAALREKATFYLTPTKIYGVDEITDIVNVDNYDLAFQRKLKKLKLAKEQKSSKSSTFYSITDSLSNLPASFQIVPSDYELLSEDESMNAERSKSVNYLNSHTNFTEDNLDTVKNKTKQSNDFMSTNDKILSSVDSIFVDGFEKVGKGTIKERINSNTTIEDVVDFNGIAVLPPAYQAYKSRNIEASRMFTFVQQNGLLSDASNKIYLDSFFGLVARIEYAYMKPSNLNSFEWKELNTNVLNTNRVLFCRLRIVNNSVLRMEQEGIEIYNEFFALENVSAKSRRVLTADNIRPTKMLGAENLSKMENNIASRISAIMNQRTTYDSGSPVAYTNIIY